MTEQQKYIIHTDGGSRGNPGPAAIGVVIEEVGGGLKKEYGEYIGETTNNDAEYQAVIFALKKFKALFGNKIAKTSETEVRADSELLIKQLTGKYKILEPKIQLLFIAVWNLKLDFKKINFKLNPRAKNKEADGLVNEALDGQSVSQKLF